MHVFTFFSYPDIVNDSKMTESRLKTGTRSNISVTVVLLISIVSTSNGFLKNGPLSK